MIFTSEKFDARAYLDDFNRKERLRKIYDEMESIENMGNTIATAIDELRQMIKEELGERPANPPEIDNGDPFGS